MFFGIFIKKSIRSLILRKGMSIPVFVISLNSSSERRKSTLRQLKKEGVRFSFVEAVDGRTLSEAEIRNDRSFSVFKSGFYSRYLRKEEIGCTQSHLNILKQIISENIMIACILEDDNDYSPGFMELLSIIELTAQDGDLIFLGHRSECTSSEALGRKTKLLEPLDYYIGEPLEMPYGSHGYITTNRAAQKLLENVYPLSVPYDVYLGNSAAIGIRTLLLQPPCVVSDPGFITTIQDENTVIVQSKFTGAVRNMIRKNRVIFGILKNSTIKFRILRNSAFRFLRKNGLIKNNYARNLN
jgi:glycosyl transferase, family 25